MLSAAWRLAGSIDKLRSEHPAGLPDGVRNNVAAAFQHACIRHIEQRLTKALQVRAAAGHIDGPIELTGDALRLRVGAPRVAGL